jgi:hypothetical protein
MGAQQPCARLQRTVYRCPPGASLALVIREVFPTRAIVSTHDQAEPVILAEVDEPHVAADEVLIECRRLLNQPR